MAAQVTLDAVAFIVGELDVAGESLDAGRGVGRLFGDQQGAPVLPVAGDHGAEPVKQAAARRGDEAR